MSHIDRLLIGMPVYNEEELLKQSLSALYPIAKSLNAKILVFNDGSTDKTPEILEKLKNMWGSILLLEEHEKSRGYGQTVIDILHYGCKNKDNYDLLITFDADLQHNPITIPSIIKKFNQHKYIDIISSSRYLDNELVSAAENVPFDRFLINMCITKTANDLYNLNITDAFSGYRGYRICRVDEMFRMREVGYSSPIEFWVNVYYHNLFVAEVPTPLIYLKDRLSRGNEKPWKERLENYLNAFRSYAWEDAERKYIDKVEPLIKEFINLELYYHEQDTETYKITNYENYWNKRKNIEEKIFSRIELAKINLSPKVQYNIDVN